jgi:hypothetical protein
MAMFDRVYGLARAKYRALRGIFCPAKLDPRLTTTAISQKAFLAQLRNLFDRDPKRYHESMNDFGFRCFSQFEEDGLLLFVFAAIGFGSRKVVEICAGDATECMATNLIVNHEFDGLLFDGSRKNVLRGQRFFHSRADTSLFPPRFCQAWITAENVNHLLEQNGFVDDIDLLSLDIDGNDYWIWKSIAAVRPRVCILETNPVVPTNLSLTIPYDPEFRYSEKPPAGEEFWGASLRAMKSLCEAKGYRLIGSHRLGFNVMFMRSDVGLGIFPEVPIEKIHDTRWPKYQQARKWPLVKDYPWVAV